MHNLSKATAKAIGRRLEAIGVIVSEAILLEISAFAERARVGLCLDNASVTAAVMFAQPLLDMWGTHWKFAYTVGLCLGVKLTTEGFYIADILEHVTDEFSLEVLKRGERDALAVYDEQLGWSHLNERCRMFRNALVNVALEEPLEPLEPSVADQRTLLEHQGLPDAVLHVLIVDDCAITCNLHRSFVLEHRPNAQVQVCTSEPAALSYWRESCDSGNHIQLLLLDLDLRGPIEREGEDSLLAAVMQAPNGFDVAAALDRFDSPDFTPPKDFRFKPLIALVTAHSTGVLTSPELDMAMDGSIRGCDILLPKPLSVRSVGALIEGCGV